MHPPVPQRDHVRSKTERLGALLKAFRSGSVPNEQQFRSHEELEYFVLLLTRSEAAGPFGVQFEPDQCDWFAARGYDLAYERACARRICTDRAEERDCNYDKRRPRHPDMRFDLEEMRARRRVPYVPLRLPISVAENESKRISFVEKVLASRMVRRLRCTR